MSSLWLLGVVTRHSSAFLKIASWSDNMVSCPSAVFSCNKDSGLENNNTAGNYCNYEVTVTINDPLRPKEPRHQNKSLLSIEEDKLFYWRSLWLGRGAGDKLPKSHRPTNHGEMCKCSNRETELAIIIYPHANQGLAAEELSVHRWLLWRRRRTSSGVLLKFYLSTLYDILSHVSFTGNDLFWPRWLSISTITTLSGVG